MEMSIRVTKPILSTLPYMAAERAVIGPFGVTVYTFNPFPQYKTANIADQT